MGRFQDKVMIVTGAARGIGKVVALKAAKEGAKLVLADINEEVGIKTLEEIKSVTQDVEFIFTNLANAENCKAVVDKAVERFGGVDILVNNAGVGGKSGAVHTLDEESFRKILDINLMVPYYFSHYTVGQMLKQNRGGAIVNVSSLTALKGCQGNCAYTVSKSAVNGLTMTMALDYASNKIRVNAVCPSTVNTDMYRESLEQVKEKVKELEAMGIEVPESVKKLFANQNFVIEPEDIANVILYLASSEANNITGSFVPVDGGISSF